MKSVLIAFFTMFIISGDLTGQWEIVNEGLGCNLTPAIDFINKDTGWLAGYNLILQTRDGGMNWFSYETDFTGKFSSLDFINDSLGWAVSEAGIVITRDGGQSWLVQYDSAGYGEIFAVTKSIVYALADGNILKTFNSGADWANVYAYAQPAIINAASFLSSDTGIFAGGKDLDPLNSPNTGAILMTFDGGESWIEMTISEFNNVVDIKLVNDSTAYFVASDKPGNYFICKTTDAFKTWSVLLQNNDPIRASYFSDEGIIICLMEDNTASFITKSKDGGQIWEKSTIQLPLNWNYSLCFGADRIGYILGVYQEMGLAGRSHMIIKSIDQGSTWSGLKITLPFNDLCFTDRNTGIILGSNSHIHYRFGTIIKTNDGGQSWNTVFSGNSNLPVSCHFTNDSNGFILTYNYAEDGKLGLLQTSDSGRSWFENSSLIPYPLPVWGLVVRDHGRFFMDETSGYIAGKETIYRTADGAESWETLLDCNTCELNSIFFTGENNGWAVGEGGRIMKITGPDKWDDVVSGTDLPLKKVFFADENTGWIAGGFSSEDAFHPVLLKTEDRGGSWIQMEGVNHLIHDIYFKDNMHGWIAGEDEHEKGIILETTDGGESWTIQADSLSAPLNAIQYNDGYCRAVGNNGLILAMFDSTSISAGKNHMIENGHDFLLQNYPNPFSSITFISYMLPEAGDVELSVLNLMGQKINTLVKEKQAAGRHEVEWDATGLQSGIYLSKLTFGNYTRIIRMTVIR